MDPPPESSGDPAPHSLRDGLRAGRPLVLPTLLLGVSFGVLARSLGWGVVAPLVCSLVVFSGSAQFAIVSVLGGGGGALPAVLAAALVNARFLPMGLALGPSLPGGRWRRALEGQAVVDASWALAAGGDGRFSRPLLFGATLPQFVAWQVGTVLGVFGGDVIGDPERLGLDAVFPAFFLALLLPELRNRRAIAAAALAAVVTLALIPVAPAGLPVVAAAGAALLGLAPMTDVWLAIAGVAVVSAALKAIGPGGRRRARALAARRGGDRPAGARAADRADRRRHARARGGAGRGRPHRRGRRRGPGARPARADDRRAGAGGGHDGAAARAVVRAAAGRHHAAGPERLPTSR